MSFEVEVRVMRKMLLLNNAAHADTGFSDN